MKDTTQYINAIQTDGMLKNLHRFVNVENLCLPKK